MGGCAQGLARTLRGPAHPAWDRCPCRDTGLCWGQSEWAEPHGVNSVPDPGDAAGPGEKAACGTRASSEDTHLRTPWPLPASHLLSLMMRLETKSLASLETLSKVSSSKYQLAARTLLSVSVSSSPKKGESPLSLWVQRGEESGALRLYHLPDPPEQSQYGQGCSRDVLLASCLQPG